MKKRLLGIVLTVCMLLSVLPISALATESFQLASPTELSWGRNYDTATGEYEEIPGYISWKNENMFLPAGEEYYRVSIYNANTSELIISSGDSGRTMCPDSKSVYRSSDLLTAGGQNLESGTYYFTIQAISRSSEYQNSDIVTSPNWIYVAPEDQLPSVNQGSWKYDPSLSSFPYTTWSGVGDCTEYQVTVYSESLDGMRSGTWSIRSSNFLKIDGLYALSLGVFWPNEENFEDLIGNYRFQVRATSADISKVQHGPWSELSSAYLFNGSVNSQETSSIVSLSPESGSKNLLFSDRSMLQIKFDRALRNIYWPSGNGVDLDFSKEPLSIYRVSDDKMVYQVKESESHPGTSSNGVNIYQDNTALISIGSLEDDTEYYVTMGRGFMLFADGTVSPEIKKGDWTFSTAFKTIQTIRIRTGDKTQEYDLPNVVWNDCWFLEDAITYNHELAKTALALSSAAYAGADNMKNVLQQFGFEKEKTATFYLNEDSDYEGNYDQVSYSFATKNIVTEEGTHALVAVVIRGTPGNGEWYSNFNISVNDTHRGFDNAEYSLEENLKQYLKTQGLTQKNVKFLVTGHSRGAAVGNLLAARIIKEKYASKQDVFGYTFATPAVSTNAEKAGYESIFNIVNQEDFVTQVPLGEGKWGYGRYGVNLALPSRSFYDSSYGSLYEKMNDEYVSIRKSPFSLYKNGTQIVEDLTLMIYTEVPTVLDFYTKTFVSVYPTMDLYFQALAGVVATGTASDYGELVAASASEFLPISLFFADNYVRIFSAHSPAGYLAWMRSCTAEELFGENNYNTCSTYKQLKVACPVDVYVYDEFGTLVASVVNEAVVVDTLAVSVNEGKKVVDLPNDQEYRVEIKARDTGMVDYTIEEKTIDGSINTTRTVFFDDIAISSGDTLTGCINNEQNTSAKNYSLTKNGETVIPATSDSSSKPSSDGNGGSSTLSQTINIPKTENGTISVSSTTAKQGTEITLTVKPNDGYQMDLLTVTDKNGEKVKLTKKSDTQYTFVMPTSKVDVKVAFVKAEKPAANPFTDVAAGDYFYDGVLWAVEKGITNGTSATTFSPNASCTRAQMVTFLWRANGSPAATGNNPFTDVKSDDYYYDAVLWAVEKGITKGTSDTTFSPGQTVTRGQTVTFLYRTDGFPAVTGNNSFTDVAGDAYYADAENWAVANDITNGTSATTFSPDADCTRGQIVTFLYRDAN